MTHPWLPKKVELRSDVEQSVKTAPNSVPGPAPPGVLASEVGAPGGAQHGHVVAHVVSHRVDRLFGLVEPLRHGGDLPLREAAVEVAAEEDVHLRVERGEEAPQHREDLAGVPHRTPGKSAGVAKIQELVLARHITEFWE